MIMLPRRLFYGYDPEDLIAALSNFVSSGSRLNIYDFGSGNGIHTLEIAKAFPDSIVVGVEPNVSFINSSISNQAEYDVENVSFLNKSIEDCFSAITLKDADVIHCCMVFPFLDDPRSVLDYFAKVISKSGLVIISLFLIPNTYDENWREASLEYIKTALPSVRFFPGELDFQNLLTESGFESIHEQNLPMPHRIRDNDVEEFKFFHNEKRKRIESLIREKFCIADNTEFKPSPVRTFFLKKG